MAESIYPVRDPVDEQPGDPEFLPFEDADAVFEALSSETARSIVRALCDEQATPSDLADRVDTSLQNVSYHLEKLEDVGLVEPVGTWYSSRGVEMDVYAPSPTPLVVCVGDEDSERAVSTAVGDGPTPGGTDRTDTVATDGGTTGVADPR